MQVFLHSVYYITVKCNTLRMLLKYSYVLWCILCGCMDLCVYVYLCVQSIYPF